MLRSRGGGAHVIQANAPAFGVTLTGLFVTPIAGSALAASLRGQMSLEFCQRLLYEYGLAQVGLNPRNHRGSHRFSYDLAFHQYGSRAPLGLRHGRTPDPSAYALGYSLAPLRGCGYCRLIVIFPSDVCSVILFPPPLSSD